MPVVCDACGTSNRPGAMFCIGCAGRLPGFMPSGPSALEAMRTSGAGSTRQAHGTATEPTDIQYLDLPAATLSIWRRLGLVGLAMMIGFTGWYLHVTSKGACAL